MTWRTIMAVTGKTGADAIFIALRHICRLLTRYQTRLTGVIAAAAGAGAITAGQQASINLFISVAVATCSAFEALATYSGF
jgi:NADPH-dependent curcumin reductase CurA